MNWRATRAIPDQRVLEVARYVGERAAKGNAAGKLDAGDRSRQQLRLQPLAAASRYGTPRRKTRLTVQLL